MTPWAITTKPCTNPGPPRQRRPRPRPASSARSARYFPTPPHRRCGAAPPRQGHLTAPAASTRGEARSCALFGAAWRISAAAASLLPPACLCLLRRARGRKRGKPACQCHPLAWLPSPPLLTRPAAILSAVGWSRSLVRARGGRVVHVRAGLGWDHLGALRSGSVAAREMKSGGGGGGDGEAPRGLPARAAVGVQGQARPRPSPLSVPLFALIVARAGAWSPGE